MRLILFGTGPFAVPSYEALIDQHEVVAMVTRPIEDGGKRRKTAENPTRDLGEAKGLKILDPPNCNEADFVKQLEAFNADLFVVCDYGQILSRDCLAAARLGGINLHGSLLPLYRGAAPIQWCVYNGDTVTGVTVIHMTAKLDGGPCIVKSELTIGADETAEELEPRLSNLGHAAIEKAIAMLESWDGESTLGEIQDPAMATKAPRLKKSDGKIDFSRTATQIFNQVRAFVPWPRSFMNWTPQGKSPIRLIVGRTSVVDEADMAEETLTDVDPGAVALCDSNRLWIQTGVGLISILEIQPSGKRMMPISDFLRGHQPNVGDVLS
ncbi:methionyl-tRNA formyltransferase [Mariniblastus fucicola]|uniref:Methionyl-tRNA formyltransferase n=1 Tax=Mariniblastus fucicola TaxID=980251 RepID=A0A5B9P121_9BACT|nr:methionyl-tRNA formyltransferase [Mariniblastus fucicola]QEG20187.1 Methionyl-tRNA formyltransferase [Mariniblastus fucicola]